VVVRDVKSGVTRVRPATSTSTAFGREIVLDLMEEGAVTDVPFHPQVQFLRDVDGDGVIDHAYCCEAASLEFLNALGREMDPFDLETADALVEYTRISGKGPDAGWGAAILALLLRKPIVYGDRAQVLRWAAAYRVPVEHRPMQPAKTVANHDLLVVGVAEGYVLLHCTYHGPSAVPYGAFDRACVMLATTVYHEPVNAERPSAIAERVISSTDRPLIASVNAQALTGYRLGTVPFVVAVQKSWRDDWMAGLKDNVPEDKDDRLCYLAAVVERDKFPCWVKLGEPWLKWLEKAQPEIVPGLS